MIDRAGCRRRRAGNEFVRGADGKGHEKKSPDDPISAHTPSRNPDDESPAFPLEPAQLRPVPKYPQAGVPRFDQPDGSPATRSGDAGVRMGEQLAKDMISARIGPDFRFAVVGAKSFFAPTGPMRPQDLTRHVCINFRFPTSGGL